MFFKISNKKTTTELEILNIILTVLKISNSKKQPSAKKIQLQNNKIINKKTTINLEVLNIINSFENKQQ